MEEALRCLLPEQLFQEMMGTKKKDEVRKTIQETGEKSDREQYDTVVMVGDRRFDVEGAREYHIVSVGVTYGYALPGELSEAGADMIVETVEELAEVLM